MKGKQSNILGLLKSIREDAVMYLLIFSDTGGNSQYWSTKSIRGGGCTIGSKQCPLHFLVVHGSIPVDKPPLLQIDAMKEWFQLTQCGKVEGIVWHCQTGALYKLHRHHIKLPWPITEPRLSTLPVNIKVDISQYELEDVNESSFIVISRFNGHTCDSISRLHELLNTNGENS
ncbi:hypothetical protein KUTeg_023481 [Tegillarca granosa]|uniref:RNA ligase 1 n=1 Tax=Tegillarca granosa TaxID=220873 RepID=A0ABQ9E1R8_TEGGR|nr:hypothetical protein KUTeg_023481 [Tegillarca granosa]